jgi:hypothetical protein
MALEQYFIQNENSPKIAVLPFMALLSEYARGKIERSIVQAALERSFLEKSQKTISIANKSLEDLDMILNNIDSLRDETEKILYILMIQNVMMLAEYGSFNIYQTAESIKIRLGFK